MHLYRQHAAELLSSGDDKKTKETSESVAQLAISHVTSMLLYPLKLVATCQGKVFSFSIIVRFET